MSLNRRSLFTGTAALSSFAWLSGQGAFAKAALSGHQVMGAYRQQVGAFEIIALNDGAVGLPLAMYPKADMAEAAKMLDLAFQTKKALQPR